MWSLVLKPALPLVPHPSVHPSSPSPLVLALAPASSPFPSLSLPPFRPPPPFVPEQPPSASLSQHPSPAPLRPCAVAFQSRPRCLPPLRPRASGGTASHSRGRLLPLAPPLTPSHSRPSRNTFALPPASPRADGGTSPPRARWWGHACLLAQVGNVSHFRWRGNVSHLRR